MALLWLTPGATGLVEWTDKSGSHFKWFLGSDIKRIND
jgi:hypothetical protein